MHLAYYECLRTLRWNPLSESSLQEKLQDKIQFTAGAFSKSKNAYIKIGEYIFYASACRPPPHQCGIKLHSYALPGMLSHCEEGRILVFNSFVLLNVACTQSLDSILSY